LFVFCIGGDLGCILFGSGWLLGVCNFLNSSGKVAALSGAGSSLQTVRGVFAGSTDSFKSRVHKFLEYYSENSSMDLHFYVASSTVNSA